VLGAAVPTQKSNICCFLDALAQGLGNVLRADTAFVALSLFQYLSFPLAMLPRMIAAAMEASISLARVVRYVAGAKATRTACRSH